MIEDSPFYDWKTEPHSARVSRAKRGENFLFYVRRDARSIVTDRNHDRGRLLAFSYRLSRKGDSRLVAVRACFSGVSNQMSEYFRESCLVTQDVRQIAWKRCFEFDFSVDAVTRASDLDTFFDRRANVDRLKDELRRVREVVNLGDDLVQSIDFADDDLIEFFSKIGVVKTLRQQLRKSLDRYQRITDLVRHARG